jgi:hypothetical protein
LLWRAHKSFYIHGIVEPPVGYSRYGRTCFEYRRT